MYSGYFSVSMLYLTIKRAGNEPTQVAVEGTGASLSLRVGLEVSVEQPLGSLEACAQAGEGYSPWLPALCPPVSP